MASTQSDPCPVRFSEDEIQQCVDEHDREQERLQELTEMRNVIGIDALGWVPDDEHLERSKDIVKAIKEGLLEHSQTEAERIAVQTHFPFDDHDKDGTKCDHSAFVSYGSNLSFLLLLCNISWGFYLHIYY